MPPTLFPLLLKIYLSEVPTVQVERHGTEVFREKPARVSINDEGEFWPLREYL